MISVKNFTTLDSALWEASVFTITLFLVSVWSGLANWAINTHFCMVLDYRGSNRNQTDN